MSGSAGEVPESGTGYDRGRMDCVWDVFYRTGLPFSVVDGTTMGILQNAGTNLQNVTVLGNPLHRFIDCGGASVNTPCFSESQFASGLAGTTFGTIPRNSFRGPGSSTPTWG